MDIFSLIDKEKQRQQQTLMMIPSENYTYPEVRKAVGSILMHKYAEGYPGRRYYQGMEFVDQIESEGKKQAKILFKTPHANVQPYSGSPANSAVYFALLEPKDTILGLTLSHGGHLTHGHPKITFSGRYFNTVHYQLSLESKDTGYFDFKEILKIAKKEKPKIIVAGKKVLPLDINSLEVAQTCAAGGGFF